MTSHRKGAWAASLTPLNNDLSVDFDLLFSHIGQLFDQGLDGVALLGTTGEANSFSVEERIALIGEAAGRGLPSSQVMIGVGCCAQLDTITLSKTALDAGFVNLLMLPPFFYKNVSEDALFRSYASIIEKLKDDRARIFIYDIPPVTGLEISVDLLVRLQEAFPNIIAGVKDSSGRWDDMEEACTRLSDFSVFAGTEKYLLPILRAGGAGCISATANITASLLANLMRDHRSTNAEQLQDHVSKVRMALQAYPPVPALKEILAVSSGNAAWRNMRSPIEPMSPGDFKSLLDALEVLNFEIPKHLAAHAA